MDKLKGLDLVFGDCCAGDFGIHRLQYHRYVRARSVE